MPLTLKQQLKSVAPLNRAGFTGGQAARIASMAEGGQILVSRTAHQTGNSTYPTSEARLMNLKGISEPVEVSTIDWR